MDRYLNDGNGDNRMDGWIETLKVGWMENWMQVKIMGQLSGYLDEMADVSIDGWMVWLINA